MCVFMYCMYACMYVCISVCMHVCNGFTMSMRICMCIPNSRSEGTYQENPKCPMLQQN